MVFHVGFRLVWRPEIDCMEIPLPGIRKLLPLAWTITQSTASKAPHRILNLAISEPAWHILASREMAVSYRRVEKLT